MFRMPPMRRYQTFTGSHCVLAPLGRPGGKNRIARPWALEVARNLFSGNSALADVERRRSCNCGCARGPRALLGDETANNAVASISDWDNDPYACGAYAVVDPHVPQAMRLYDRPIGQRLFFAGEASRTRQPGTVGGAVLAGQRVAQRISETLAVR